MSHKIKHLFPYLPSNLFLGVSNLKYMQSQFWKSWQLSTFSLYNSSNVFEVEHSWELWTLLTSPLLGLLSSMEIKTGAWNRLCITVLLHVANCFVVLFVFLFWFFFFFQLQSCYKTYLWITRKCIEGTRKSHRYFINIRKRLQTEKITNIYSFLSASQEFWDYKN